MILSIRRLHLDTLKVAEVVPHISGLGAAASETPPRGVWGAAAPQPGALGGREPPGNKAGGLGGGMQIHSRPILISPVDLQRRAPHLEKGHQYPWPFPWVQVYNFISSSLYDERALERQPKAPRTW